MVERLLAKEKVAGSNPVFRSIFLNPLHENGPIQGRFRYFADQIHKCRQHWTAIDRGERGFPAETDDLDLPTTSGV